MQGNMSSMLHFAKYYSQMRHIGVEDLEDI